MADNYDIIMIDLDNGKSVVGNTKQFLNRMTEFVKKIDIPIQMVYYQPYHSKYNLIEQFWAAIENYSSPLILNTVQNTIKNSVIFFIEKDIKVSKKLKIIFNEQIKNPNLKIAN